MPIPLIKSKLRIACPKCDSEKITGWESDEFGKNCIGMMMLECKDCKHQSRFGDEEKITSEFSGVGDGA